jgi:endonuclease/exonuclease/phosphatase (EEP) superfamily protein YafD
MFRKLTLLLMLVSSTGAYAFPFLYQIPKTSEILTNQGQYPSHQIDQDIKVLVWNSYKGQKDGWKQDFGKLTSDKDIVMLQEYYSPNMKIFEEDSLLGHEVATSFMYIRKNYARTGVSTAATARPVDIDYDRTYYREPFVRTPKMSVLTTYDIESCSDDLLVVNTHGINFVTARRLRHQLRSIANKISMHQGPVIWAGDFNTWTRRKMSALKSIGKSVGLTLLEKYETDKRLRVFKKPLDHVLYRGLDLTKAKVLAKIDSSDHKPIEVNFRANCN